MDSEDVSEDFFNHAYSFRDIISGSEFSCFLDRNSGNDIVDKVLEARDLRERVINSYVHHTFFPYNNPPIMG
jgi:hypothetical protein